MRLESSGVTERDKIWTFISQATAPMHSASVKTTGCLAIQLERAKWYSTVLERGHSVKSRAQVAVCVDHLT